MGKDVRNVSRVCRTPPNPLKIRLSTNTDHRGIIVAASLITILSMAAISTYLFWIPLDGRDNDMIIPLGHGVIEIDGDADFAATALLKGWPGNGTPGNPYLIDGLDIDRGGAAGYCIYIKNTRVSFIMRNCRFTGANVSETEWEDWGMGNLFEQSGAGILLYNVANGELVNNTCNSNDNMGIFLLYSHLNTVANNTCNNNGCDDNTGYGILLCDSESNTVTDNTCSNNEDSGILLFGDSNTVANNTCTSNGWAGIGLCSDHNTVTNNTCSSNGKERDASGGGISLGGDSNTVANNTCTSNGWAGINLGGSSNTVANNTCNDNRWGIGLYTSTLNTVANNTCNSNDWYGIFLDESVSNTVANNTCTDNFRGIILCYSNENTVANNMCNSNDIGISLDSAHAINFAINVTSWLESKYNTVANNICNNNEIGIRLNGSSYNTLENNTCNSNDIGIFLDRKMGHNPFNNLTSWRESQYNTVADNTCNNNRIGIYLRNSISNTVTNNTFEGNTEHDILEESETEEIPPDISSCSDSQKLHFWVQGGECCQEYENSTKQRMGG